jgi:hypothetical protein
VVQHPMKRRGAEDSVEAVAERKSDKIGSNEPDTMAKVWRKILLRVQHHVAGNVEADDAAARKILHEKAGQFPGAATRIQQAFIAAQSKLAENALSPVKLRRGEAVILGGVPLAGV